MFKTNDINLVTVKPISVVGFFPEQSIIVIQTFDAKSFLAITYVPCVI